MWRCRGDVICSWVRRGLMLGGGTAMLSVMHSINKSANGWVGVESSQASLSNNFDFLLVVLFGVLGLLG